MPVDLFKKNSFELAGLDISSTSVKCLKLSRQANQFCVDSFSIAPMPAGSVVEKSFKKPEEISKAIHQVKEAIGSTVQYAAAAVSDSAAIIKTIQLDSSLDEDDLETLFNVSSNKFIPFPISEVRLDFEMLGPVPKKPDLMNVLLVATRIENVNERVGTALEGGIEIKKMEVESYAIERAVGLLRSHLPDGGKDKLISVIDIGSSMMTISILHDMKTVFTRDEILGGDQLTKSIQKAYGLSYSEAGRMKRQGGLPYGFEDEVLKPFVDSIILQVRRGFQMFFSSSAFSTVDHILLAGGTANIKGLDARIEEELGITTSIADPFTDMVVAPHIDTEKLRREAPALLTACGLALRNFD